MSFIQTEGIILRASAYEEKGQIASLFTPNEGKLQAFFSSLSDVASKTKSQDRLSPLMRIEATLSVTRTNLYKGRSYFLQDSYAKLRTSYTLLNDSCLLLQAVDISQAGQKPAPLLYKLLTVYLNRLDELQTSQTGLSSFYLKILRHEGLFTLEDFSQQSEEEQTIIEFLSSVRNWEALIPLILPEQLHTVIATIFHEIFDSKTFKHS